MTQPDLTRPAAEHGRAIAAGRTDPVELTDAYLEAAAAHPDTARIFARTTPERARAEALAARDRAKAGVLRGPLDGVPISWKDLYDTAGVATEAGSALLQGRVPKEDAEVLQRATRAGLVCLGKTHMTELAFAGLGYNPVTATPPNIHDPALLPGGSSSGAATSVAFGLAAAGIGSDTGGSVRVPAAWNDLVGLKTTEGALPLDGVVKLCRSFDTVGPLTRTVEDSALLWSVMNGSAPIDLAGASLSGCRFLVLETVALEGCEDAIASGFQSALDRIGAAGATLETGRIAEVAEAMDLSGPLFAAEAYAECGELIESAPEKMFENVLERFRSGGAFDGVTVLRARHRLADLRRAYLAATAGYDAVLIPTTPILPPLREAVARDKAFYTERNLMTLRNTRIGNLMGLCAVTVPTGAASVGLLAMGAPHEEARVLRVSRALEATLD